MVMDPNKKINWIALEYEEKERGNDWFWALGIIVVTSSIASFIYGNYFFGLLIIIGGILMGAFAIKKPDLVEYEMSDKGLKIRNRLFPYKNIKHFWVQKEDGEPTLFIKSERVFMPIISMPIDQDLAEEIRNLMLANNVIEEKMKDHPGEKIMDSLGF
jgi:hypothetical protein